MNKRHTMSTTEQTATKTKHGCNVSEGFRKQKGY